MTQKKRTRNENKPRNAYRSIKLTEKYCPELEVVHLNNVAKYETQIKKKEKQSISQLWQCNRPQRMTDEQLEKIGRDMIEFAKKDGVLSLEEFANEKNFLLTTLIKYEKTNEYFAELIAIARQILRNKWIKGGAIERSGMREGFAKFYLSSYYGLSETVKTESENTITLNIKT